MQGKGDIFFVSLLLACPPWTETRSNKKQVPSPTATAAGGRRPFPFCMDRYADFMRNSCSLVCLPTGWITRLGFLIGVWFSFCPLLSTHGSKQGFAAGKGLGETDAICVFAALVP
ncbi:hypothetical protein MAPG_08538 [Magnaporthiopsis poae ATCC 64411]|uniref:Secreted protein n=1 Tax=Magnaporthiopsis poae (strain ATCC 64411 / 73-15) TaxID=644358 RepID=A0A0C4E7M3_MAGP6|nr:hypothetical protein MAPG_08538 [Magnaporthiopsis poae ATCC 64411]